MEERVMDFHCKFAGIDGESTHEKHSGEVEIHNLRWNVNQPSTASAGSGSAARGQAVLSTVDFEHGYDKSSPTLAKHCFDGKVVDGDVIISGRRASGKQELFVKWTLKGVTVAAVSPSFSAGGTITESVSLQYNELTMEYTPFDATGKAGGSVKAGWNRLTRVTS